MTFFVIPGYSPKNKEWAYRVKDELSQFNIDVYEWPHWESGDKSDFRHHEIAKDIAQRYEGREVLLLAKSVGILIASLVLLETDLRFKKAILCGLPLNDFDEEAKEIVLKALPLFPTNTVVFQNEFDNHGTYLEAQIFLENAKSNLKIIKKERNDHEYPYFDEFKKLLS